MFTEAVSHALHAIDAAPINAAPWPHLVVTGLFPATFYPQLLENLPTTDQMQKFAACRWLYWIEQDGVPTPGILPFWAQLRDALFPQLGLLLQDKFGVKGTYGGGELLHDHPGYSIGPHTDTTDKLITGLMYLPGVTDYLQQGTILLSSEADDPTGKGKAWNDPKYKFRPGKTVPYIPNAALFFVRTDRSFHAVNRTPVKRWILAYDVFK